ncbi:hypothetical protein BDW02DRAFT_588746 [Decorospora gaudefroyi]|uniref:MYND-type domain-containing protein n=1 Tax=Decorospora gaudefroyi TaxID=184978 RepID=A0A6A5KEH5_9PLEO|nr:hypothetical protein BDW02DRAFT_588746 [Decorospora gaudefroyi]
MATEAQAVCTVCGEPARSKCSACETDTASHHYCGTACQTKDWPRHKRVCKELQDQQLAKTLARVADIAQQAYYDFRQNTWDTPIVKIEDGDDALVIYDGDQLKKAKHFIRFPEHLPLAWMHNFITGLLEGLNVKVEEVSVDLEKIPRKITVYCSNGLIQDNWPSYHHQLIHLTSTKTKKKWALDISGAQYGILQAFWSWEDYEKQYMMRIHKIRREDTNRILLKRAAYISGHPSMAYGVVGLVAKRLDEAVNDWVTDRGMSLSCMVALSNKAFDDCKADFLSAMENTVRSFVRANDFYAEFQAAKKYELQHPGISSIEHQKLWNTISSSATSNSPG